MVLEFEDGDKCGSWKISEEIFDMVKVRDDVDFISVVRMLRNICEDSINKIFWWILYGMLEKLYYIVWVFVLGYKVFIELVIELFLLRKKIWFLVRKRYIIMYVIEECSDVSLFVLYC